jgi:hypothetical protein
VKRQRIFMSYCFQKSDRDSKRLSISICRSRIHTFRTKITPRISLEERNLEKQMKDLGSIRRIIESLQKSCDFLRFESWIFFKVFYFYYLCVCLLSFNCPNFYLLFIDYTLIGSIKALILF